MTTLAFKPREHLSQLFVILAGSVLLLALLAWLFVPRFR